MNHNEKYPGPQPTTWSVPVKSEPAMSLRDYFAGQALAGIVASGNWYACRGCDEEAKSAYLYADAMLAERSEKK